MLVLLFVTGVACAVCFMLGRAVRLNRRVRNGDALVNLQTGEVFEPGSRRVREGQTVTFTESETS